MVTVNTVLGTIDTNDMGFTLMHEHIIVGFAGVNQDYPELLGDDPLGRVVDKLKQAKEGGVDTIVDATTTDLGRDINFIAEASRRSGVNIIAVSGWWMEIPRFFQAASVEQLTDVFVREIEKGISGTDIKAGILKAASDSGGVTPQAETVLRAVGRAHLRTGVPIMLHSYSPGQVGWQQLDIWLRDSFLVGSMHHALTYGLTCIFQYYDQHPIKLGFTPLILKPLFEFTTCYAQPLWKSHVFHNLRVCPQFME